jgi:hypothetical protein
VHDQSVKGVGTRTFIFSVKGGDKIFSLAVLSASDRYGLRLEHPD